MDDVRFDDISISKTEESTFAIAKDLNGILYSWGSNTLGQLGLGDHTDRPLPTRVSCLKKKNVSKIKLGSNFVVALGQDISESAFMKKKQMKEERRQLAEQVPRLSATQPLRERP